MEQSIERIDNQAEKAAALKSIIELAKTAGLIEILNTAEQELDTIEKNEVQNEQKKNSIPETVIQSEVSPQPIVRERQEEVDLKIDKLKEEISNTFNTSSKLSSLEIKPSLILEFTAFKEFSKNISNFKDGKLAEGASRQRFTYNPDTGELLPSREGLQLAQSGMLGALKETFNFNPKIDFSLPIEKLQFKSALIDNNGFLIQKGEILASNESVLDKSLEPVVEKASEEIVENKQERDLEGIPYQEYSKQFSYFDNGESTTFSQSSNSTENLFSYNPETGQVLPRKEGWEYVKSNLSYFLNKYFTNPLYGEKLNTPLDQLRFIPAKVNKQGSLIEKGRIIEA